MSIRIVGVGRASAALSLAIVMLGLAIATGPRLSGQTAVATVHLTSGWATFGEAVPQGLSHGGLQVGSLLTQTDVKNRWPDGSIRFAIVTVKAPAEASYLVSAAPASSGTFKPIVPTASVTLRLSGVPYTATLPASTARDRWLSGPLVDEGRTIVAPISGADGRAHPFLRVNFDTRAYNDGQARVDVSVENMLDQVGATTVTYDVTIVINGRVVFSRSAAQHSYLTRWRKVFDVGSRPLAAVTPDISPFTASRALPPYLSLVTNRVSTPTGAKYDILREGALRANMPAHGGQDAAPFPDWTARYLVHKDARQRSFVLANGDLSGSWPVHVREADGSATSGVGSERLISLDQRPTLWYDARAESGGFDHVKGTPQPLAEDGSTAQDAGRTPLIPDNAHQPSIAFVPYLLTGDRYYAEEMAFWANYAMLRTYNGDGMRGAQGILQSNDVQGIAWALRNLADAAAYYPDASPVKEYLSQKVLNNLEWLDTQAPSQIAGANPGTIMWALAEQNTLAYAIDRASKLGFVGGLAYRDAIAKLQLALVTGDPDHSRAEAAAPVVAVAGSTPPFADYSRPQARLSLMIGVESGWAGARAAYDHLWPFLGMQPTSGRAPELAERAGWALDFYSPDGSSSTPPPGDTTATVSSEIGAAATGHSTPHGMVAAAATALPHNIPDFGTDSSRTTVRSVQSGNWSSASTWSSGQVPTANQVVHVDPGHVVTIGDTAAIAYTVAVHGTLRFNPTVNTRLKVTNLMVMGDHGMPSMTTVGHLEIGTAATPIAPTVTAELVIANTAIGGGVADPEQFGTGLLNFGKLTLHGTPMTPTWTRVSVEPRAGHTTLTLSEAVTGWRAGDRIVLPDTRHLNFNETDGWVNLQNQWEERTIQSVSGDGRTLTLTAALQFDHLGARDFNNVLEFLPHVGNLTRNVIVRSESAGGTRGHVISVHVADSDIRYALFKDLGRTKYRPLNTTTNVIGRYPIHMHHNRGPVSTPANGYQFTLVGNAVDGGSAETQFKWGIAVHNSHYGLIQDNVVYNYNGSAIATEDGSESFNVFDHNFALRGMGEPNNAVSEARFAMGTEGVGFWFRGPNNYVRNNVAANYQNETVEAAYGFVYQFRMLGNVAVPNFKGADTSVSGQFTTRHGSNLPLLQFENNEAYGAMQGGFTYWWVGGEDPQPFANAQESVVKDLKIWHTYNKSVYIYPGSKVTFDGLQILGKHSANSHCCGDGVHFSDYSQTAIVIRNSDIQGMGSGIDAPSSGFGPGPNLTVENSILRNWDNINVPTPSSVNGCWMGNMMTMVKNTQLQAPPGRSLNAIGMDRAIGGAIECLSKQVAVRVYGFQGNANDNFQIYHSNGSVMPRPPGSCTPTTRTGIDGLTCTIPPLGGTLPTATLTAAPQTIAPGQSATLTWSTSDATSVSINQGIGTVAASGARSVSPGSTTTYTLTATNASGSVSAAATVTVSVPDTTPPVISGVASSSLTTSGATISFTTNEPAYHQVEYGPTTAYGTMTTLDTVLRTSHSTALTGLTPGTLYHYRARARDAAGNVGLSADFTFTTSSGGPSGQRSISINFAGTAGASMGATESAGAVVKANWNNATGATRSTPLALQDETGAATGATVTWSSDNLWDTPIADEAGSRRMMKGYLDNGFGNPTTVTVAGLPAGAYDVYVYADGDNGSATRTGGYRISGAGITTTTVNLTDAGNTNFNATFSQANNSAGNFVKFSINASGFALTATPGTSSSGATRAPVNGIQIVSTAAAPTPDFTIAATPAARTVTQGSATSYTVGIGALNGFAGTVNLAVSGLPANATASFAPASVTGSGSAALNVTTAASTPAGSTTLTITGTSGSLSHTATVSLVVNAAAPPADFTISATPGSRTVSAGGSASYTLAIGALNGFAGTVSLAASGLPANATASFTPPSVAGSGSSTMNVTTAASTPAGSSTLTITGSSGALTHSATVQLVVSAPSVGRAVSINFVGDAGGSMGAAESAGVVAKVNWNNATGATRSTPLALTDETGAATGATLTWSADNLWHTPIADQAGNRRMMRGYLDTGFGGTTTLTVAGLPAGTYDVYVYVDGDNGGGSRTGGYRISGAGITTTTINLTDAANTSYNTTFTEANNSAGNFVKFSITASGFTLTATPGATSDGRLRAPVNGVQIVPR